MNKIEKAIETTPQNDDEDDLFYFESDHLALRGNIDYSEVLKTMFILEAQRNKALKDYNKLVELKKIYLNDPLSYVEKARKGELVDIPKIQSIIEIPKINWSKYPTNVPEPIMKKINSSQIQAKPPEEDVGKNSNAWTPEEQRKLEELLIKYPPEEVDRKRIVKIANELGTRTREQVASRLQKYFLKLMQAGLPIPGRLPRTTRKYSERKQGYKSAKKFSYFKNVKPSTFFPETFIPVVMDDMHAPGPSTSFSSQETVNGNAKEELSQNNYLLSSNYHVDKKATIKRDDVDIEMELLKWVKSEKELESRGALHQHYGYKCDYCEEEPIQGTRWHCTTCINNSVDYCTDCILSQFYSQNAHDLQHKFLVIRNEKEVTNGFWSESESESDDGKSKDGDEASDSEDCRSGVSSIAGSMHGSDNISKISEECPSDIFDPNHRNGFDTKIEEL